MNEIIGLVLGVFFYFMIFDSICVKIFNLGEFIAVWYSFFLVSVFFIVLHFMGSQSEVLSVLILRLFISIIFLIIFLYLAKKDEKEYKKLESLPYDTEISISELSVVSKLSIRKIKYYVHQKKLQPLRIEDKNLFFSKGISLEEIKKIKDKIG